MMKGLWELVMQHKEKKHHPKPLCVYRYPNASTFGVLCRNFVAYDDRPTCAACAHKWGSEGWRSWP